MSKSGDRIKFIKYFIPTLLLIAALTLFSPLQSIADSTGTTELVGIANDGSMPNNGSNESIVSSDGRYIYFASYASNLVPNDTNNDEDIFVRDRLTGTTSAIDVNESGEVGNLGAHGFCVSEGGRYVVFSSLSSNLVTGNFDTGTYLRDMQTGTTSFLTHSAVGEDVAPAISGDGNWITFINLNFGAGIGQNVYLMNRQTQNVTRISNQLNGSALPTGYNTEYPDISYDGSAIVFYSNNPNIVAGDTNGKSDDFVWQKTTNTLTRVDVSSAGSQANGNVIKGPHISGDGNKIVFASLATNLVSPSTTNTNVYIHEVDSSATTIVSTATGGQAGNGGSGNATANISEDGNYVVFDSAATNLVASDTNNATDIFLKDAENDQTTLKSLYPDGTQPTGSDFGNISADGQYVAFTANIPSGSRAEYLTY